MRCIKCGEDFPSKHYLKSNHLCHECFQELGEEEKSSLIKKDTLSPQKSPKKYSLASFLRGFLTFIYYLVIVTAVLFMIGFIAVVVNPEIETWHTFHHFGFLYKLTPLDTGQSLQIIEPAPGMANPELELLAAVRFNLAKRELVVVYFTTILVFIALSLIIINLLRKFLLTVQSGSFFIKENIKRVRQIGLVTIVIQALEIAAAMGLALFVKPVEIPGMAVKVYWQSIGPVMQKGFWGIFLGLVILAIAEIFRLGAKLQEENELTI
jgi:hypothetical protein